MGELNELNEVERMLTEELAKERRNAKLSYVVSAALVLLVLAYTSWMTVQIEEVVDPTNLALSTTGMVLETIPSVSKDLKTTLVDGAPQIARSVSEEMIASLPAFRLYLQDQMGPVVDQVAQEMTTAAVARLSAKVQSGAYKDRAPSELANALVEEFASTVEFALDEKDANGESPRARIAASLATLEKIDHELKLLEAGKNLTPDKEKERELLMGWMEILVQASSGVPGEQIKMHN